MQADNSEIQPLSPAQGWESVQATLDLARSSMYVAGWTTIMLLWGAIVAVGYVSTYAVETWAPVFAEDRPWYPGLIWGGLGLVGMVGSSLIGHRASKRNATGPSATAAGLRVFAYWMTVVTAAFAIPAASGLWTADVDNVTMNGIAIGIVALGYVLFGILHHLSIALVGLGIAVSFYAPTYLAGDAAPLVSAALMLTVVAIAWLWIRRYGTA